MATVVFPAPDGPTSATVLPAGTVSDTSSSAGRRRPGYVKRNPHHLERRRVPVRTDRRHARPVGDGDRLGVDRVKPLGRGERVRELAPDLGDLPHRHEGGQREQRQQRHDPRIQRAAARPEPPR